jgi:two-component system aerobic respiration control sensor histidine kinase ArcB
MMSNSTIDLSAELAEEKSKRQAAEAEVRRLRTVLTELEAKAQQPAQAIPRASHLSVLRQQIKQKLTNAMPAPWYVYHLGRRNHWFLNDCLLPLLQYEAQDLRPFRSRMLEALLHPDDRAGLQAHYAQMATTPDNRLIQIECRLRSKGGQWKWFRFRDAVLTRHTDGTVQRISGFAVEITAEKNAYEELKQRNVFFENLVNNGQAELAVFDKNHRYLLVNPHTISSPEMREWIIGKDDFEYCAYRDIDLKVAQVRRSHFLKALQTSRDVSWEEKQENSESKPEYILRKYHPVADEAGNIAYVISYGWNITSHKQAELQLEGQQEFIRQVMAATPNPVYVRNEQGEFVVANRAFAQLHELTVKNLLKPGALTIDYSYRRDLEILGSTATVRFKEYYRRPQGQEVWFDTIKKPFTRPDGSRYLLSISSDITDLNWAQKKAQDSARAKEIFMANMSHEIRTPMNGILGIARMLQKTSLSPDQSDYLDIILTSADNLLVVINDVLDFAKIESGKVALESIPFNVTEALQSTTKSLSFRAEEKGLYLRLDLPSEPIPTVEGDPHRLNQVLVNLINNAIKFTSHGGVTVRVRAGEAIDRRLELTFKVEDTGIGIPSEKFEAVFESFTQAYSSTSRVHGGTGLGLTICKNLVELQGGSIWLESKVNLGSHFYFTIPYLVSDKAPLSKEREQLIEPELLRDLHVLLVEDNTINQLLAFTLLSSWNVKVTIANDGQEALQKVREQVYDLILMDIQMPRMNGVDATMQIRKEGNVNQHTPIIALTANALKNEVESYEDSGFTAHLVKPYHENDLYQVLARCTGRDKGQQINLSTEGPDSSLSLYDFSMLGSLADDADFVRKMQQLFLDTVPQQLQQLQKAIEAQDWEQAARLTHSLKANYGNLGIITAANAVRQLEEYVANQTNLDKLSNLLQIAREVTTLVANAFTEQLSTHSE